MTEFAKEWIDKARNACIFFGEPATTEFRKALDEIESLKAKNERLKHYLEEAAHAAACGKNPADYLAREVPTDLRDEIQRLQQRIAELEQERRWIYQDKTMIVKKDGDSWCAVLPDFKDLQQSESRWFSGDINKYMDDVYWYLKR